MASIRPPAAGSGGPWQPHESVSQKPKPVRELVTEHLKKPKRAQTGEFGRSPDNFFVRHFRPLLPLSWQYGFRWTILAYTYRGAALLAFGALLKYAIYDPQQDEYVEKLPEYDFVKDDSGKVMGIAPRRVVQQINKSRERSAHWRQQADET